MDEIISRETAILAKQINFDEWCDKSYMENARCVLSISGSNSSLANTGNVEIISAPTQTQLSKWLRENDKIHVKVDCNHSGYFWEISKTNGTYISHTALGGPNLGGCWDTFEEAMEAGLFKALEILKERK